MNAIRHHFKYILIFFVFFLLSSAWGQPTLEGDYIMTQYLAESGSYRFCAVYEIFSDGESNGTWKEIHPAAVPDSGVFSYELRPDRTFTIFDGESDLPGTIDDKGEIFTMVQDDTTLALITIGIKKSSGRTNGDLIGEYYMSEFSSEDTFQVTTFNLITFDGAGKAQLYRLKSSVTESGEDTVSFNYVVHEDGQITFDDRLIGALSADGQVFTAAWSDSGRHTLLNGIKKSSGRDNGDLSGHYTYNQYRSEHKDADYQTHFYSRLFFDGSGDGFITMFNGEPFNGQLSYTVSEDGRLDFAEADGAVSADSRYFFSVETYDSTSVAFGFGITVEDPMLALEGEHQFLPTAIKLSQNYPNPFNPITMINYQLPMNNEVELSVYNLLGQKVVTLVNEKQPAGSYKIEWDASVYSSGIYFYVLETSEGVVQTRKMMLIR